MGDEVADESFVDRRLRGLGGLFLGPIEHHHHEQLLRVSAVEQACDLLARQSETLRQSLGHVDRGLGHDSSSMLCVTYAASRSSAIGSRSAGVSSSIAVSGSSDSRLLSRAMSCWSSASTPGPLVVFGGGGVAFSGAFSGA